MKLGTFLLMIASLSFVSCSDEQLAERRNGLKWEKDQRQAQEDPSWGRPDSIEDNSDN